MYVFVFFSVSDLHKQIWLLYSTQRKVQVFTVAKGKKLCPEYILCTRINRGVCGLGMGRKGNQGNRGNRGG